MKFILLHAAWPLFVATVVLNNSPLCQAGHGYFQKVLCDDKDIDGFSRIEVEAGKPFADTCESGKIVIKDDADVDNVKILFQLAKLSSLPLMKVEDTPGSELLREMDLTGSGTIDIPDFDVPEISACGRASVVVSVVDRTDGMLKDFYDIQVKIPCPEAEDQDLGLRVTEDMSKISRPKIAPGTTNVFQAAGLSEVAVISDSAKPFPSTFVMSKPLVSAFIYNNGDIFAKWDNFRASQTVQDSQKSIEVEIMSSYFFY